MTTYSFKTFLEGLKIQSYDELILDSINDRGRLKAIFVVGLPGSGKSYTVKRLSGDISPVVINTDRAAEFISKKTGIKINKDTWEEVFSDKAMRVTSEILFQATNGLLPLFIDGTAGDTSAILRRAGILEGLGYDVGMVWIDTSLDTAKRRAEERAKINGREVDVSFIDKVHAETLKNKDFFSSRFQFFVEYRNNADGIDNTVISKLFSKTRAFYDAPLKNGLGRRHIEKLTAANEKYLTPTILTAEKLRAKMKGWYE